MKREQLVNELRSAEEFFVRSTECIEEQEGDFRPAPGALSVIEQTAHVAQAIDWLCTGALSPTGFDLDFENGWQTVRTCKTLTEARERLRASMARAIDVVQNATDAELTSALPAGPVMGGQPVYAAFLGIVDHTAHHRGALTVYARLLGKEPKMPYG